MISRAKKLLVAVAVIAFAAAIWELSVRMFWPSSRFIVPFSQMLATWPRLGFGAIAVHIGETVYRAMLGFVIAAMLGILVGLLIARWRTLEAITRPIIDFLRPLPSSALIPLATLVPVLGLTERSYLFIIVYGTIWPVLFGTLVGVEHVNQTALDSINQLPLSRFGRIWNFTLPEAAPEIFTGLRIALSISYILAISAELLLGASKSGLGRFLQTLADGGDYAGVYGCILIVALVGWILNGLFRIGEGKVGWLRARQAEIGG